MIMISVGNDFKSFDFKSRFKIKVMIYDFDFKITSKIVIFDFDFKSFYQ